MNIAEIIMPLLAMLTIGIVAGFIGSILGIGGGLIVTPIVTAVMGVDIKYCIAASIIVVIATSSGSTIAYLKDNILNLRVAMFLEIFTTIGALVGALITGLVEPMILYILFACMLVFSVVNMIRKILNKRSESLVSQSSPLAKKLHLNSSYYDVSLQKQVDYEVERVPLGAGIMFGAGIASGLLGIGSGVFKVIAMDNAMKMPLKPSTSTSNLMMGVTAAASALIYFCNGQILPEIAAPLSIGVLLGAAVGSRIMPHLKPKVIRIIFVPVMLILAANMILKAFGVTF